MGNVASSVKTSQDIQDVINCPVTGLGAIDFTTTFAANTPDIGQIIKESTSQAFIAVDNINAAFIFITLFIFFLILWLIMGAKKMIPWWGTVLLIFLSLIIFWSLAIAYRESLKAYLTAKSNSVIENIQNVWNAALPNAVEQAVNAYVSALEGASIPCPAVVSPDPEPPIVIQPVPPVISLPPPVQCPKGYNIGAPGPVNNLMRGGKSL